MDSRKVTIELEGNAVLALRQTVGALVRCIDGAVWITEEGDRNDYVLKTGQFHELSGEGRTLVQAMGGARVALEAAEIASFA
jgi:hypothetical protein